MCSVGDASSRLDAFSLRRHRNPFAVKKTMFADSQTNPDSGATADESSIESVAVAAASSSDQDDEANSPPRPPLTTKYGL